MKKYNLSKIMKRAWELVKKISLTISEALKKAWKEAKRTMKGSEKQIKWAEDIKNRCLETIEINIETCKKERLSFQPYAKDFQREFKAWEILRTDMENIFAHEKCQDASYIIDRRDMLTCEKMLELHRMKVKELEEA